MKAYNCGAGRTVTLEAERFTVGLSQVLIGLEL